MTNSTLDIIDRWILILGFTIPTAVITALWLGFIPL